MKYNYINENAGDILFTSLLADASSLEDHKKTKYYIQCRFFQANIKLNETQIKQITDEVKLSETDTVFLFDDGDIIFELSHSNQITYIQKGLKNAVRNSFEKEITSIMPFEEFFIYYDWTEPEIKSLKRECIKKQGRKTKGFSELEHYMQNNHLIETFAKTIKMISMQRMMRTKPNILIVEDQVFSQRLMTSILKDYACHISSTTSDAILKYIETCPDIVMLDINLPDLNGHTFAKFINNIDSDAYVVMVTGNNHSDDVKLAKENNVKGFITKPIKKDLVLNVIEKFMTHRKKKYS